MSHRHQSSVNPTVIAARLAADPATWQPLLDYDPVSRFYARLASERDYEAWLLTWVPGQGTEWHDHGGSAGAFVTVLGTLTERHAINREGRAPRVAPGARQLRAGDVRTFGSRHLHKVTNIDLEPAASIHVYAPALKEMNHYIRTGDELQLAESRLAGVNW